MGALALHKWLNTTLYYNESVPSNTIRCHADPGLDGRVLTHANPRVQGCPVCCLSVAGHVRVCCIKCTEKAELLASETLECILEIKIWLIEQGHRGHSLLCFLWKFSPLFYISTTSSIQAFVALIYASSLPSFQPTVHQQLEKNRKSHVGKDINMDTSLLTFKLLLASPCQAQERIWPPRPFVTWPQPTFPPTARISGSSYTEITCCPMPPSGQLTAKFIHIFISFTLGKGGLLTIHFF